MDTNAPHSLRRSFELHLRAENRAPNTIDGYLESIRQAKRFLASRGKTLQDADRADLEAFMADLLSRRSASTAATRYKGLRMPYAWLEEEEIPNPMARAGVVFHSDKGCQYTSARTPPSPTISRSACRRAAPASALTAMILRRCPGRPDPCYDRPGALALTCRPVRVACARVLAGRPGGDLIGA